MRPSFPMKPHRGGIATAIAFYLALAPTTASGQEATYSGGVQYAAGHFIFEERTEAVYFTNGLRLRWDVLEIGASVPLAIQNGGLVTLIGSVPIPTGGEGSGVVSRRQGSGRIGTRSPNSSGTEPLPDTTVTFDDSFRARIADPTLSIGAELYSGFGGVRSFRVDSRVSVPVNDLDSGIGSGEWDYALGGSIVFGVRSVLLFADASYWWIGDLPDLELQDALSYGIGLGIPIKGGDISALVSLTGMTETISTVDPPLSIGASVGWLVGDRTFMNIGGGAGLTESAPDVFAQFGWSVRLTGDPSDDDDPLDGNR